MTYPKFSRVAEMRVELTGKSGSGKNEWTVTINSISYANADAKDLPLAWYVYSPRRIYARWPHQTPHHLG